MLYTVIIKETLLRGVAIEASNNDEALKIATELYFKEDIVLSADDFDGVTFSVGN